jgi:hypothetical protein
LLQVVFGLDLAAYYLRLAHPRHYLSLYCCFTAAFGAQGITCVFTAALLAQVKSGKNYLL